MPRPKKYNRAEVLEQSVDTFWRNGFDGTSMDMLDAATGLNRGSIYNAFGDKRGLYLAALDHYGQIQFGAAASLIQASGPPPTAVKKLFDHAIKSGNVERGCFVCNAAVEIAPADPDVAEKVQKYLSILTAAFKDSLVESCHPAAARSKTELLALAEYLTTSTWGSM